MSLTREANSQSRNQFYLISGGKPHTVKDVENYVWSLECSLSPGGCDYSLEGLGGGSTCFLRAQSLLISAPHVLCRGPHLCCCGSCRLRAGPAHRAVTGRPGSLPVSLRGMLGTGLVRPTRLCAKGRHLQSQHFPLPLACRPPSPHTCFTTPVML